MKQSLNIILKGFYGGISSRFQDSNFGKCCSKYYSPSYPDNIMAQYNRMRELVSNGFKTLITSISTMVWIDTGWVKLQKEVEQLIELVIVTTLI